MNDKYDPLTVVFIISNSLYKCTYIHTYINFRSHTRLHTHSLCRRKFTVSSQKFLCMSKTQVICHTNVFLSRLYKDFRSSHMEDSSYNELNSF